MLSGRLKTTWEKVNSQACLSDLIVILEKVDTQASLSGLSWIWEKVQLRPS